MDTSQTSQVVVDWIPTVGGKGFPLGNLAMFINYDSSYASEFSGNAYPRYPMTLEVSLVDGDFTEANFLTGDGVVETLSPPMQKSWTIRSGFEFATGLIQASAQGGKWQGTLMVQPIDNATYPFNQAGFNPEDITQWINLASELYISVNEPWWDSLISGLNFGEYSGVTKQISFTLTDGTGYRTKHTVYLELWTPQPV